MDFLDRLIDFIEEKISLNASFTIGKLSSETSSISIRPTPSSIREDFLDRGNIHDYSFQILCKDRDQMLVIKIMNEITSLLHGLNNKAIKSNNNSFTFINCKVYVLPNYLQETEREYIYTAMFTAEIEGGI